MKPCLLLAALAATLVLSACRTAAPGKVVVAPAADAPTLQGVGVPPEEADSCGAKPYFWLVGESRGRIPTMPKGSVVRVVCSTCAMTMDFNASRMNIIYDEKSGMVSKLSCG